MRFTPRHSLALAIAAAALLAHPSRIVAQTSTTSSAAGSATLPPSHDGSHDFDWMFGDWKATLRRLVKPLTGSTTWEEFEGRQLTKKVWNGKANLDEFNVDNPTANVHIEGMALRLYDASTQQWRIYWANSKRGIVDSPVIGRFTNGRGEFYGMDELEGRAILVRYAWSNVTPTSAHFEQSFSPDGGKTWETNWISDISRAKE